MVLNYSGRINTEQVVFLALHGRLRKLPEAEAKKCRGEAGRPNNGAGRPRGVSPLGPAARRVSWSLLDDIKLGFGSI